MHNEAELLGSCGRRLPSSPTAYWAERLTKADIMHERLNGFRDFLAQPQTKAIDLVSWLKPAGAPEPVPVPNIAGSAPFADGTPRGTTPVPGQHTADILRQHGFSAADIAALMQRRRHRAGVGRNSAAYCAVRDISAQYGLRYCALPAARRNSSSRRVVASGCSCCTQCPAPSTRCVPSQRVQALDCMRSSAPGAW